MTVTEIVQGELTFREAFWQKAQVTTACSACTTHGCCKELVAASSVEVIFLLAGHAPEIAARWGALVRQAEFELAAVESGMAEAHQMGIEGMPRNPAARYFPNNQHCVLRVDGKCSVYDLRPLPCLFQATPVGTPFEHCEPSYDEDVPHLNCWNIHKMVLDNYREVAKSLHINIFPALDCGPDGVYPIPLAMSILFHVIMGARTGWFNPQVEAESALMGYAAIVQAPWLSRVLKGSRDHKAVW